MVPVLVTRLRWRSLLPATPARSAIDPSKWLTSTRATCFKPPLAKKLKGYPSLFYSFLLKIISIIIPRSFQRNGNWIPITHWWLVVTGGSSFSRWPPEPIFRLQLDAKYQPSFVCFFFNCCFKSTIMKKKKKKGNQRCCTYLLSQFVFCLSNKRVPFNRPLSRWHLPPAPSKKERKSVCVCECVDLESWGRKKQVASGYHLLSDLNVVVSISHFIIFSSLSVLLTLILRLFSGTSYDRFMPCIGVCVCM